MQHIQDKDLDNLFKNTFENAEVTPSADFWGAISNEITPKKKGRKLPVFWMAAASVAAVLTITLLFNREEKIKLYGEEAAAVKSPAAPVMVDNSTTIVIPASHKSNPVKVERTNDKPAIKTAVQELEEKQEEPVRETPVQQTYIAMVQEPEKTKTEKVAIEPQVEKITYAQAEPMVRDEVQNDNNQAENRAGIRNVGDLVNFVVDKVDKREKKAIRFKTDDDESSLIGINIGFLKFNSKKKDR